MRKTMITVKSRIALGAIASVMITGQAFADGVSGINMANSELKTYVAPVSTLILAIGAIVGLIGGIRVYVLWNSGERDINKELMGWFGSCIFLVLVGTVIKAFFA